NRTEKYRDLMAKRIPLYRRVATIRVDTNRRNPGAVVRYITSRLPSLKNTQQPVTPGAEATT
ncbi:MAG TPA: shikimate kinase, partial [Mycobacterium sp.]|nr:shikimate kinase [Mycobacterium sp.]